MALLDGDLADAVYAAFKGKLKPGVIRQMAAAESGGLDALGDPTDANPVFTALEGFDDRYSTFIKGTAGIPSSDVKVCIIAKSMPGITPGKDDKVGLGKVAISRKWFQLRGADIDPAGALWECQAFEIPPPEDAP